MNLHESSQSSYFRLSHPHQIHGRRMNKTILCVCEGSFFVSAHVYTHSTHMHVHTAHADALFGAYGSATLCILVFPHFILDFSP